MATDLIPVVQRSYDLCAGLYEHVDRFPRAQRGLLGRVILEDALQMLVLLTTANRQSEKSAGSAEASGRLDALRITLRLSKRLGFLSNGGYEQLSGVADEVGRMLGGWLKYETGGAPTPEIGAVNRAALAPALSQGASQKKGQRSGGVRYTMTSPTIEKYLRKKLEHPQVVVFITVGAFCQTFFEDAVFCGQALRFAVRNLAAQSEPGRKTGTGYLSESKPLISRGGGLGNCPCFGAPLMAWDTPSSKRITLSIADVYLPTQSGV